MVKVVAATMAVVIEGCYLTGPSSWIMGESPRRQSLFSAPTDTIRISTSLKREQGAESAALH